jgi:hypothetical protein
VFLLYKLGDLKYEVRSQLPLALPPPPTAHEKALRGGGGNVRGRKFYILEKKADKFQHMNYPGTSTLHSFYWPKLGSRNPDTMFAKIVQLNHKETMSTKK